MRLPIAEREQQRARLVEAQHLVAIAIDHQDVLIGANRDAVRVRDQALPEGADKPPVAIEHDNRRIGSWADIETPLGIDRAFADHAEGDTGRQRAERPLDPIDLFTQPDVRRGCLHGGLLLASGPRVATTPDGYARSGMSPTARKKSGWLSSSSACKSIIRRVRSKRNIRPPECLKRRHRVRGGSV